MAIEKDLLLGLKCTDDLHDGVIELFLRKERRRDFCDFFFFLFSVMDLKLKLV